MGSIVNLYEYIDDGFVTPGVDETFAEYVAEAESFPSQLWVV